MLRRRATLILSLLALGAAPLPAQDAPAPQRPDWLVPYGTSGLDLTARDLSVRPGDDFNLHASGAWLRTHPIPEAEASYGVWLQMIQETERQLRAIVERPGGTPAARQVGDFYASWMDEAGIEARGIAPARPWLARIEAVRGRDDLLALFADPAFDSPVGVGITPDPADPTRYVAAAYQAGLGMPGRDYYLREGADYDRYRAAYRNYLVTLQRLAGIAEPEAKADSIIALERRIAEAHWTPERSRDVTQMMNPMTRAQIAALAPQFDWPNLLRRRGLGAVQRVIVGETTAIAEAGRLLESVPLATWKAWLAVHFLDNHARFLPHVFDEARFAFRNRTLNGTPQQLERWNRGVLFVDQMLGEALGRLYVERHFPAESRRVMGELIGDVRGALEEKLRGLDWMDEPTRREALAKLVAFEARVGGPVRYIDYSPIRIERNDLLGNVVRARAFEWRLQLSRLPHPVDRALWEMTPQTTNAYYSDLSNQITFPAAMLQRPLFHPSQDPAVNYGSIGCTIGHEIGHGFDDQGRRFDGAGRLRDWWSAESARRFVARTARLRDQYAAFEPLPGLRINGELTLGENIGDLGGLEIAYAAYRRYVARHGELPVIDGLTGDQRFFLSYAQFWRNHVREDSLRQGLLTDPHSPTAFRINGVVRNMDAWYRAFDIRPGDRLYLPPEQRVHIW
ncbi:MAG TPA: M13 family metallopeptidase [Allosphingosinicella sp.]|jgi:endothelin-converting enzyme/putative endopeptidase|nr:M13 family metallopeptidase [Allosphingosinicella sp.]